MDNVFDVLKYRRSIRRFADEPVSKAVIRSLIYEAANAPSACGCQSYHFIAVRDKEKLKRLADVVCAFVDDFYAGADEALIALRKKQMTFFADAPAVIFVTEDSFEYHDSRVTQWYQDKGYSKDEMLAAMGNPVTLTIGAAVENLLLAAQALEMGACFMTDPIAAREALEKELNCKGRLAAVVPIGYPDYTPREKTLKPLDDLITFI